jgi:hypothetical protein
MCQIWVVFDLLIGVTPKSDLFSANFQHKWLKICGDAYLANKLRSHRYIFCVLLRGSIIVLQGGVYMYSVTEQNGNIFKSPQQIWLETSGNACLAIKVSRVLVLKTGNFGGKIDL